jgi:hypothetical protein
MFFGLWSVPQFGSGDAATRCSINGWHELAANALIVVATVHALAALGHHYGWRDHLLDHADLVIQDPVHEAPYRFSMYRRSRAIIH